MADTIKVTVVETGPPGPAGPIGPQGPAGSVATVSAVEPLSAVAGDMWYKDDTDELFVYNDTIGMWEQITFVSDFSDTGTLVIGGGTF